MQFFDKEKTLVVLGLVIVASIPYICGLTADFVFDDRFAIIQNSGIQSDIATELLTRDMWGREAEESHGSYRPVTVASFVVDNKIGGGEPFVFHLSNIIFHIIATLLFFFVVDKELGEKRVGLSIFTSMLFAVHALHSENVFSIVARADILAMILGLCAWLLWRSSRVEVNVLAGVFFLLALLAKEVAIVFFIVPIYRIVAVGWRGNFWNHIVRFGVATGAVAVYLMMRVVFFGLVVAPVGFQSNPLALASWYERLLTAASLLSRAIGLLVVPAVLSADYSFAEIEPVTNLFRFDVILGLLLWLFLPVGVILLRHKKPVLAAGIVFFLVAYIPISNMIFLIPTIFAERLLYIASAGFCLVLAVPLYSFVERHGRLAVVVVSCFIALHGARISIRAYDWQDQYTLFVDTVRASPRSARAWHNLGHANIQRGRLEEGARQLQRAVTIAPQWVEPRSQLGAALVLLGAPPNVAHAHLRQAFEQKTRCSVCARNLVSFYLQHGRPNLARETIDIFREAGGGDVMVQDLERDLIYYEQIEEQPQ